MLDRWAMLQVKKPLDTCAGYLNHKGVSANQVTLFGFFVGICSIVFLSFEFYGVALICILGNRLCDGIDGNIARLQGATDEGGFLDITLDFIFYSGVVFGFACADPMKNGLAAAGLIFSFMGTGSSFLAFAIMAERRDISNLRYPNKGFYYLDGLTEGTETILFFIAFCLVPQFFSYLAWVFSTMCLLTTVTRLYGGYHTLKNHGG